MASARSRMIEALDGGAPDSIPFAVYRDFVTDDPAWERLFDAGLAHLYWTTSTRQTTEGVERTVEPATWQGGPAERVTLHTPAGAITQLSARGWVQEYWLKTPSDYRVMEYIVRHTRIEPDYARLVAEERELGERGVCMIQAGRSPMQTILVDYAGLEAFAYHLAGGFPELDALAEALLDQLVDNCRLIAAGPGTTVSLLENLTAETWGPRRFACYHLPVYERILPILHAGGKTVHLHFDGKLASIADLLARTDIDGIESLTQPPEGDVSYTQARAAWPDKLFWGNINVSLYSLPPTELTRVVRDLARQAAPDGRRLILEISEDLPPNWRAAIPVVLEALAA
jgi:hypothetical protein